MTALGLKFSRSQLLTVIVLVASAVLLAFVLSFVVSGEYKQGDVTYSYCPLRIVAAPGQDNCVTLEKATTEAARIQGLSGRKSMSDNQGMLFVFEENSQQCMWMKDMKFSLDMVWLNNKAEIVKLEKAVAPNTYPSTYCSEVPASYVLELNAGVSDKAGLHNGQKLSL